VIYTTVSLISNDGTHEIIDLYMYISNNMFQFDLTFATQMFLHILQNNEYSTNQPIYTDGKKQHFYTDGKKL